MRLDDLKKIHEFDKSDALGIAQKQADQYCYEFNFSWNPPRPINNIVVVGMGGSALAATAIKNAPELSCPLEVVRNYQLPSYVDNQTLLICSSYSGNTEETLSALKQALEDKNPMIVCIASGGELLEIAGANQLPFIKLPGGYQPRMTFGYQFRALEEILASVGVINNCLEQLETIAGWLKQEASNYAPTVPKAQNLAKQLALELVGKSIVVYAGPKMFPAAYKWKINFNENAKNIAWCNQLPEFNHNEFVGWTSQPTDKPYAILELRSALEHPRTQKRFEISQKLLSGKRPNPEIVNAKGENELAQLLWTAQLGDFVSLYLALLNGLDPTPVDLIEKLKKELSNE